jgi:hypothetical protein
MFETRDQICWELIVSHLETIPAEMIWELEGKLRTNDARDCETVEDSNDERYRLTFAEQIMYLNSSTLEIFESVGNAVTRSSTLVGCVHRRSKFEGGDTWQVSE